MTALIYRNELWVGGNFISLNGVFGTNYLAKWTGSTFAVPQNGTTNGDVWALALYQESLYAGGLFTRAGNVVTNFLARYNGTNWYRISEFYFFSFIVRFFVFKNF